jgi:flagellar basal body P-ring formation protein FlgA
MRRWAFILSIVLSCSPGLAFAQSRGAGGRGAVQRLSAQEVQRLAEDAIASALPPGLELDEVRWNTPIELPRGRVEANAYVEGAEPTQGRLRARVELVVDGEPLRTIRPSCLVSDQRAVVVASRRLQVGEVVEADDVELRPAPPSPSVRSPLRDPDQAIGMVVTRAIEAGEVVEQSSVEQAPAVRRRQPVRIVVRSHGVEITAPGEPLEDGAIGEVIQVVCLASRRALEARVTGPGEVEVW